MLVEKSPPLEQRAVRYATLIDDTHCVPNGTHNSGANSFYQHSVPNGTTKIRQ